MRVSKLRAALLSIVLRARNGGTATRLVMTLLRKPGKAGGGGGGVLEARASGFNNPKTLTPSPILQDVVEGRAVGAAIGGR